MRFFILKFIPLILTLVLILSSCVVVNIPKEDSKPDSEIPNTSNTTITTESSDTGETSTTSISSESSELSKPNDSETSKHSESSTSNNSESSKSQQKKKAVEMFKKYGEYKDGAYRFYKYDTADPCSILYTFSYSPDYDLFYCGVLVTTYSYITMYDSGSVSFSWGDFKNALFLGYHELEDIALIEFEFFPEDPKSNMTFGDYDYDIESNNYDELDDSDEIDNYANICFECLNQSLAFAQSILNKYTSNVKLW